MMKIRPVEAGDTEPLSSLYRAFIATMQNFDGDTDIEDVQLFEWIAGGIAGIDSQIWVADAGNLLVGFARVRVKRRDDTSDRQCYAKLNELFVSPDARHQGLAKKLMGHTHAWAAERRLPVIVLNVYLDNNPAKTLYERLGYTTLRFVPGNRVMMVKALAPSVRK